MDTSKATPSPRVHPTMGNKWRPMKKLEPWTSLYDLQEDEQGKRYLLVSCPYCLYNAGERGFENLLTFMDFLKTVSYFLGHLLAYDMHMCVGEWASKESEVIMKTRRWHPISKSYSYRWLLATLLGCWKMNSSPIQELLLNFLSSSTPWVLMGLLLEHVSLRAFHWKMECFDSEDILLQELVQRKCKI